MSVFQLYLADSKTADLESEKSRTLVEFERIKAEKESADFQLQLMKEKVLKLEEKERDSMNALDSIKSELESVKEDRRSAISKTKGMVFNYSDILTSFFSPSISHTFLI